MTDCLSENQVPDDEENRYRELPIEVNNRRDYGPLSSLLEQQFGSRITIEIHAVDGLLNENSTTSNRSTLIEKIQSSDLIIAGFETIQQFGRLATNSKLEPVMELVPLDRDPGARAFFVAAQSDAATTLIDVDGYQLVFDANTWARFESVANQVAADLVVDFSEEITSEDMATVFKKIQAEKAIGLVSELDWRAMSQCQSDPAVDVSNYRVIGQTDIAPSLMLYHRPADSQLAIVNEIVEYLASPYEVTRLEADSEQASTSLQTSNQSIGSALESIGVRKVHPIEAE